MSTLVNQPTMMPSRKVTSGAVQGLGAVVGLNLVWTVVANRVWVDVPVPDDINQLVTWLVSLTPVLWQSLASYFTRERVP